MLFRWILLISLVLNLFGCSDSEPVQTSGLSLSHQCVGSKSSTGLGFKNLGNTCFANAALKLLSACPDILRLTNPNRDISTSNYYPEFLAQKNQIKKSFYKLFNKYQSHQQTNLKGPTEFFETELSDLFDQFDQFLEMTNDYSYPKGTQGYIRNNGGDADDFLQRVLSILNFNQTFTNNIQISYHGIFGEPDHISAEPVFVFNLFSLTSLHKGATSVTEIFNNDFERNDTDVLHGTEVPATFSERMIVNDWNQRPRYFFVRTQYLTNKAPNTTSSIDLSLPVEVPVYVCNKGEENRVWDFYQKKESVTYDPTGYIIYTGGHYYAYLLDQKSGVWFKHDDHQVTSFKTLQEQENFKNDINSRAYLILYSREKENPAAG